MAPQIRKLNCLISGKGLEAVGSHPWQCGNWAVEGLMIQSKNRIFHTAGQFCPRFVLKFGSLVHHKQLPMASSEC